MVDAVHGHPGDGPALARQHPEHGAQVLERLRGPEAPVGEQAVLSGRMYGPGIFPQVLYTTRELVGMGVPVIAGGGVYTPEDAEALVDAGALAAQVDTALWRGDWLDLEER